MATSLYEAIEKNASKVRFHTPSHAGTQTVDFATTDVTELPYTDNLLCPASLLSDLEQFIASVFRAEACFISTQGATHNILQAIFAEKENGAFLIVGQAHASVYNALRVLGAKAYHVDVFDDQTSYPSDVKTVIFTSPDYFGNVLPLRSLCDVCHVKGLRVIVDSAHGSHFAFSQYLPVSASEYADSVILSLHKTLPVATGGSILLTKKDRMEKCSLCRKLYHTSSPSFPVLCTIERAVKDFAENGERYYEKVFASLDTFGQTLQAPYLVVKNDDRTRLVIRSPYDGSALYDAIAEKGFVAEMSYEDRVVFIVNPYNHTALPSLAKAVNEIRGLPLYEKVIFPQKAHPIPTPMAFGGECELISLSDALGRKAYLEVGFYPPGVPLLYAGDELTMEHIRILSDKKYEKHVFGLESGKIFVLK